MRRAQKQDAPQPIRQAVCLAVRPGADVEQVRDDWELALKFLTASGQLRLSVNHESRDPEIRLDWHALPSEIAQYTALLQTRDEYGGRLAHVDVWEGERASASQRNLGELHERRKAAQTEAESAAKVALLQPRVCSLEGLFEAAELGNVEALRAMVRGFPLPTYDTATGTYQPNADRTALPQPKHVLRQVNQLAHTASARHHAAAGTYAAGDPMDDLRQAAPFLFGADGKMASTFDLRDAYGKTPLHIAAASGQHLAVAFLIAEGADANAQDRMGQTPLHLACLSSHRDAVRELLTGGARVDLDAADGRSVMHYAAVGCNKGFVNWLLLDAELEARKFYQELEKKTLYSKETVLHLLALCDASTKEKRREVLDTAKIILKAWGFKNNKQISVLLEAQDSNGRSALMTCAASDSFELMRYLASCGSSPNLQSSSGDVALHISVRLSSVAACNFLVSAGTDLSIANADGDTPLHVAAAVGNLEIFKMCFQACPPGLTPPATERYNSIGDACIHVAARLCDRENEKGEFPYHEILQFAVLNRADPMHLNAHGLTSAMAAALGGNPKTVLLLVKLTTDEEGHSPMLSARNNEGENIWLFAARAGSCAVLETLAQLPAVDTACVSHTKMGALSMAAFEGHRYASFFSFFFLAFFFWTLHVSHPKMGALCLWPGLRDTGMSLIFGLFFSGHCMLHPKMGALFMRDTGMPLVLFFLFWPLFFGHCMSHPKMGALCFWPRNRSYV